MKYTIAAAALAVALVGSQAVAQQASAPPARPTFSADGIVHVPAFEFPASGFSSPEAVAKQRSRATAPAFGTAGGPPPTIEQQRADVEAHLAPQVAAAQAMYPVNIAPQVIAGVPTQIITPRNGETNRRRVLINLHGGGFTMCAQACALVESIPFAGIGGYKVITVNYRQGPENRFPAASEDVAAVYRDLLRTYRPENIGIFGCSAGGALTGQVASWLQHEHLPNPGAIGIFGAGATRIGVGDSTYISAYLDGTSAPPRPGVERQATGYFAGANLDDPLVSPAVSRDVLSRFPPTLLITGTRAMDMSSAVYTHSQLLNAGAESQLIVAEGQSHCFINDVSLPEARDALTYAVHFFDTHLGVRQRARH